MGIKESTLEKHRQAETTPFMKAVFSKKLPADLWADFTYQKSLIYNGIESVANACELTKDLPDVLKAHSLYQDYRDMVGGEIKHPYRQVALDYYRYILSLFPHPEKIMPHLYVWHMGDLYGGQMLKKIVPGPHRAFEFAQPDELKVAIRSKLTDDMADEANVAFEWAIKLLNDYDVSSLG